MPPAPEQPPGNPLDALSQYDLRHLPAHLVAVGRLDDVHRLLLLAFASEPAGGRVENAWFAAKDASNELASYVDDVELAWRSQQESGSFDVPQELGYALIRSSLRTITTQVPDALVVALVERGVWSAEQGLSHAFHRPGDSPGERRLRALLLARVLREADPPRRAALLQDVRDEARELPSDARAEVLWELLPAAPEAARDALGDEALAATRASDQRALGVVLPRVPPSARARLWPDLQKAFGRLLPEAQEQALTAIVPALTPAEVEQAVALTRKMPRIGAQGAAVAALVSRLPDERRRALAADELAAGRRAKDKREWAGRLTALCPALPAEWTDAALDVAGRAGSPLDHALALAILAPALGVEASRRRVLVNDAIAMSREHGNAFWHAKLLAQLTRACAGGERASLWEEAFAAVRGLGSDSLEIDALRSIAPFLDSAAAGGFAELVSTVDWDTERAHLLGLAAEALPSQRAALLHAALAMSDAADSDWDVSWIVERLAPALPEELLDQALERAGRIEDRLWRLNALEALAPRLDAAQLRRALASARAIGDGAEATRAILAVAAAGGDQARTVWLHAHTLASAIRQPRSRASALTQLARTSPARERAALLDEALAAARALSDPYERDDALAELSPELVGDQREAALTEALQAIAQQDAGGDIRERLQRVGPLLSPRLLDQALEFARGLQRTYRAHAIGALAPFVPAERRAMVFNEALSAATSFENPGDLHQLVLSLAPHLPPEAVPAAVSLASTIDDSIWRPHALAALAPHLDDAERRKLGVEVSLASPPVEPAARVPDVRLQALDEALASVGGDAHRLEQTVAELAPAVAALSPEAAAEPAARVVRELGAFERPDALRATTAFVPALLASGDATAVVAAIGDAQAWWP